MEDRRLQWLDVAKGITILLMVLGHTSIPMVISNFIFAFHMPLFFFASGYCTNWEKDNYRVFLLKKLKSLGIPFVIYSIAVIIIAKYIGNQDIVWRGILVKGWEGYALWFVPVLFFSFVIAKSIMRLYVKWLRYAICVLLILSGVFLRYRHVYLPWTLATVPYASCLVLVGSSLRKFQVYFDKPRWWILGIGLLITIVISQHWRMDMAWNCITPVILLSLGAVAGTAMMFSFSSFLTKMPLIAKILQTIGKETFVVMAFSQILCLAINHFFSLNKLVEYGLMFSLLIVIVFIKNGINIIAKRKVL